MWIYHFEAHAQRGPPADQVIESLEEGRFRGVASELTLLELTVQPLRLGRQDAAALRARQGLRTPDAIQIATGLRAGATLAVTNDQAWRPVPLIETALLPDLAG